MLLLLSLTISLAQALAAAAHHVDCSWRIGDRPPHDYGFYRWCIASVKKEVYSGRAVYTCDAGSPKGVGDTVATYNFSKRKEMEFTTPCGSHGYAGTRQWDKPCQGRDWAVCIGDADPWQPKVNCFYMNRFDDCEWPAKFDIPPALVDIWYRQPVLSWPKRDGNKTASAE
ncbi:unnamed protein product [Jaminaea pallidilutea]